MTKEPKKSKKTDLDTIIRQATAIREALQEARERLADQLRTVEGLIGDLSPSPNIAPEAMTLRKDVETSRGGAVKTLDELVLRAIHVAERPLLSREITELVSSVRPTERYVISSILSRLQGRGLIKVQGSRGAFQYSETGLGREAISKPGKS